MDLEAARAAMIDSQVRPSDVTDRRLISAMAAVKRELFVPADLQAVAYADMSVETGGGRWLMQARDFAKLVHAAAIVEDDRVLDIASGTGYSTAVLSRLAGSVTALEDANRVDVLKANLLKAGVEDVEIIGGDLKAGAPTKAPFDVIVVNGTVEDVPQTWLDQLTEGGRLVVPVLERGVRRARVYLRSGAKTSWRTPFETGAPVLPGFELVPAFKL